MTEKFDVMDKKTEKKTDEIMNYLSRTFGVMKDTFEVFCDDVMKQKYPEIQETLLYQEVAEEEIDIFSESPLVVAECTLKLTSMSKIKKAIRKREAIEKAYGMKCKLIVFANWIDPEFVSIAEETAQKEEFTLIHGMNYEQ